MSKKIIFSVTSSDRTGIVADVCQALLGLQGNLENVSQTVLQGYFSMILLASFPDGTEITAIQSALHEVQALKDCQIAVLPFVEQKAAVANQSIDQDSYVLTASAQDRPGLLSGISRVVQKIGGNIIDLACHTDEETYTMMFLIHLPQATDIAFLKQEIQKALPQVSVGIRHEKLFEMGNEI